MNPTKDSLYGGIAGVSMNTDQVDLGHGVVLSKTFAHFMAPFLMAFAPAEKGKHHPGPLSVVNGGIGFDIHIQIFVPSTFALPNFFDRLNTVWWITALIRLCGAFGGHLPVIADRPFSQIPENSKEANILPVEVLPRQLSKEISQTELSDEDIKWLRCVWITGGRLMGSSVEFNDAFQALDAAGAMPTKSVALLAVWGALERLFSPDNRELRFRVSANIAAYLEEAGEGRLTLQRRISKLYDARSSVAHGTRLKSLDAWAETHELANRIVKKILTCGQVPSREDLDNRLFAPNI